MSDPIVPIKINPEGNPASGVDPPAAEWFAGISHEHHIRTRVGENAIRIIR
jgi:hypothetical protein